MVEILGFGVECEERESLSAVGSFIASIMSLMRQIIAYGIEISLWLVKQLHEHPFESLVGALNIAILLA
jgi:hypothetical protein